MRVAGYIGNSVVNGIGIRNVLFLQGCVHYCPGCHNPQTWSFHGGDIEKPVDVAVMLHRLGDNDVTISGGEPMLQFEEVIQLMDIMNTNYGTRFWLYTGFTYDEIPPVLLKELAKYVDVLVDGRFEIDKKDLRLQFRGSSNQRLIDLPKSVANNKIILWEGI